MCLLPPAALAALPACVLGTGGDLPAVPSKDRASLLGRKGGRWLAAVPCPASGSGAGGLSVPGLRDISVVPAGLCVDLGLGELR